MYYRKLTSNEINILDTNGCLAENWNDVEVKEGFNPARCRNVRFSGKVKIGVLEKKFTDKSGVPYSAGIENALIHNCTISDNVSISNIKEYIANYIIDDEVVIRNCGRIYTEGKTAFGNETSVAVMSESGGRSIKMWDRLSSHLAYIMVLYRHRPLAVRKIEELIRKYTEKQISDTGFIGKNSRIINCAHLRNIRIGPYAHLEDVLYLNEGSINSNQTDPIFIGTGVIMNYFIINSGSMVTESAVVERCFIGQGCELAKQFSAYNSLFFSNCKGFHGEVCSVFAGPYTVTHHKSTLLIAGIFSFMNAGSGSNQSNHMYKLGPVHQGVVERGTKTASDSYLLWPAHIGPFNLVKGRHLKNADTSAFPFSYLIENNSESVLIPGINLVCTGTIRDERKWSLRDVRKDPDKIDCLNFTYLNPFSVARMIKGSEKLVSLRKSYDENAEFYCYNNNLKISASALIRGIGLYNMGITKFIGDVLIDKINGREIKSLKELRAYLDYKGKTGAGEWVDLAGLIVPKTEVEKLLKDIESDKISSLEEISGRFHRMNDDYDKRTWEWVADYLEQMTGKPVNMFSTEEIIDVIEHWKESMICLNKKLLEDAGKEFSSSSMTGFGMDGNYEEKLADYQHVRGSYETDPVVESIRREIDEKSELADKIIENLKIISDTID
ncbi:MAG: DUF4954 family protein [Bacteroidales bacterium]